MLRGRSDALAAGMERQSCVSGPGLWPCEPHHCGAILADLAESGES